MLNTNLPSRQIHSHTKIYTEYVRHLESAFISASTIESFNLVAAPYIYAFLANTCEGTLYTRSFSTTRTKSLHRVNS